MMIWIVVPFNIERFYVTSCPPYSLLSPTPPPPFPPQKKCAGYVSEKDLYQLCISVVKVSSFFVH